MKIYIIALLAYISQAFHSFSLIKKLPSIKNHYKIKNNSLSNNSFIKLQSHFSVVSSKITNINILKKTLFDINKDYDIYDGPLVITPYNYNKKINADLVIKQDNYYDIGFVLENNVYNMITDLQFWNQPVSPDVFMERVIKQYTINSICESCEELGFYMEHINTNIDTGFTEIIVSKYNI